MNSKVTVIDGQRADIALCASVAFRDEWSRVIDALNKAGLTVHAPLSTEAWGWDDMSEDEMVARKKQLIDRHLANIKQSKVVLICNYDKPDEPGYVGANTLIEMTAAYLSNKPIYILNKVPISGKGLEIRAFGATVLNGSIEKLIEIFMENKDE